MNADEKHIKSCSYALERISWLIVLFSMISQLSTEYAFPAYNIALGFWGNYCAFSQHGRATFGYLMFTFLSIILDVVFCSVNSFIDDSDSSLYQFCLAIFILTMFLKLYALYAGAKFFASIGGSESMEFSYAPAFEGERMYRSTGSAGSHAGGYYPPSEQGDVGTSFMPLHSESNDDGIATGTMQQQKRPLPGQPPRQTPHTFVYGERHPHNPSSNLNSAPFGTQSDLQSL